MIVLLPALVTCIRFVFARSYEFRLEGGGAI